MRRRRGSGWVPAILVVLMMVPVGLALVGPASGAARRATARLELRVVSGRAALVRGRLGGAFVVKNVGRAAAARSIATLTLGGPGRRQRAGSYRIRALRPGDTVSVRFVFQEPNHLSPGRHQLVACTAGRHCRVISAIKILSPTPPPSRTPPATTPPATTPPPATLPPTSTPPATPPPSPAPSPSTVPSAPITYTANTPVEINHAGSDYWVDVPPSYDATNMTPTTLLVWLHGCGGVASGDIYNVSPGGDRSYLAIAVSGESGSGMCWDPANDVPKVLAAIADAKTHFNVSPRRVILGGYSSGGDLGYRTIFYHANSFAGLLAENTSPFRDTGSTQTQSLAAAAWKFNVVHLAHEEDSTYPIGPVTSEVNAMKNAGFPVTFLTQPGDHYDDTGGHGYAGTDADLQTYLLPHLNDGWLAPPS